MAQEELLRRIAERVAARGTTERQALLAAKLNVDFVRDIRRRGHSPTVEKLAALARALDTPLRYFTDAVAPDAGSLSSPQQVASDQVFTPDSTVRLGPPIELPSASAMPRDLPVYGTVEGGPDGEFELLMATDLAVDLMRRPPGLMGLRNVFALYTVGESMSPWREPGDPVFVHPDRQAKPGQYAVIVLRPKDEHSPRRAMVKRYVATRGGKVIAEQFNPRKTLDLPQEQVVNIWRVIDFTEAFGFS